jgi:leukotriene-A4 hydrolase
MKVFVSGIKHGNVFKMDIPIPSYLFAFLIGKFEHKKINGRMGIVAEPQEMDACVKELDQM